MDVKVITSARTARDRLIRLVRQCEQMSFAVAWATPGPVFEEAMGNHAKFKQLVIGTHRCVTDPEVLSACSKLPSFRAMMPKGKLFHPKVYLFQVKETTHAFVGSNNLTANGFGENAEVGVLMSAPSGDAQMQALLGYIDEEWRRAKRVDATWIEAYAANRRRTMEATRELDRWVDVQPSKAKGAAALMQKLEWADFLAEIQRKDTHIFDHRLKVLAGARALFGTHASLGEMDVSQLKRIAGTTTKKEFEKDQFDWQYFGGMGSSGGFSTAVINAPQKMSRALDVIPIQGDVTRENYDEFVEKFIRAYGKTASYKKSGTGTRLLAMKRPDWFVAMNGPNKKDICDGFGVPKSTTDLSNYWERIIEPMQLTPWWRTPRPTDVYERQIWDGRAAMLDCLCYNEARRRKA